MARIAITKKDGTPTGMFWSDRVDADRPLKTVYREAADGRVLRSRSIRYDLKRKKLQRV